MTGSWAEVERRQKAAAMARQWRPFRVSKIVEESAVIRSFHLEPTDGAGITPHAAGQFLPIRVVPKESAAPLIRTYSLSVAPSDGFYRLTVKRGGVVSSFLHDHLREGERSRSHREVLNEAGEAPFHDPRSESHHPSKPRESIQNGIRR
jgi:uncharacterized protein